MPTACRLSQTLGHAKGRPLHESTVVVRFAARALSHKIQVAAGASPPKRSAKVAWFLRHRRSRSDPAFAESTRWRRLESKQGGHVPWRRFRLGTKPIFSSVSQSRPSSSDHSRSPKLQGHFGVIHAGRLASVGMLRHPNANTNTRQGCGLASVA